MKQSDSTLSFYIPGAPNDAFISQIAMFRMALNALGGIYQAASIVAFLGDRFNRRVPERWLPYLQNVELVRVPILAYWRHRYKAQGDMRWRYNPASNYVVLCDADTLLLKPMDDLLQTLAATPAIAGVIANHPLPVKNGRDPQVVWTQMAQTLVNKTISFDYRYTLPDPQVPYSETSAPFYLNFGFIVLPALYYQQIAQTYAGLRKKALNYVRYKDFSGQAALALAIEALNLNKLPLSVKYNYANYVRVDHLYPAEMQDIRVLHYMGTDQFDRHEIFASESAFNHFANLELAGSNAIFQKRVLQITGGKYPFV